MRSLFHLFVAFQQLRNCKINNDGIKSELCVSSSLFPFQIKNETSSDHEFSSSSYQKSELDIKMNELLNAIKEVGPVGSMASPQNQERIQILANGLEKYSIRNPAKYPLKGEFKLLYSSSSEASSGRFFGTPISGDVKQIIIDSTKFRNIVKLGPIEMTVKAKRQILNGKELKITLLEGAASLFGIQFVKKDFISTPTGSSSGSVGDGSGSNNNTGMWKCIFVGTATTRTNNKDGKNKNKKKLIRIMQAPNLFILEQDCE